MNARAWTRNLAATAASLWLAFSPLIAFAADVIDGSIPANGKPSSGQVGATWDGARHHVLRSDASGILRTTEEYPYQLLNDAFPAADTTNTVINGVLRPLGLGWSVSPFGSRTVTVTKVNAGPPNTVRFLLFGSDDNVNYYPIIPTTAWTAGGDSTKIDTLEARLPTLFAGGPNTVRTFKISLPEIEYPGRYVQIWATRTDSAFATNTVKIGLTYEGRWK